MNQIIVVGEVEMGNESCPSTSFDEEVARGNESHQNISFGGEGEKGNGVHQSTAFDGEGAKASESLNCTSSFEEVANVSQNYTSFSSNDANSYSRPSQCRYRCQKTMIYPSSNPYRNLTILQRPMQPAELPKAWERFGGTLSYLR